MTAETAMDSDRDELPTANIRTVLAVAAIVQDQGGRFRHGDLDAYGAADVPHATVTRALQRMESEGYLQRNDQERYWHPTPKLLRVFEFHE